eukprot:scaffold288173_cov46-Prasinocladus_malaysianus.AAC.1
MATGMEMWRPGGQRWGQRFLADSCYAHLNMDMAECFLCHTGEMDGSDLTKDPCIAKAVETLTAAD